MAKWYLRSTVKWAGVLCGILMGSLLVGLAARGDAAAPDVSSARALSKLTLGDQPIALLGGRLSVRMPAVAKVEPRRHSIMAAPASNEDESRVVVDAENERLVLMAYELYALSGGDLEKSVRADVTASWHKEAAAVRLERLTLSPPLKAVAVVPLRQEGNSEANLVLGLYVGSGDGTVHYLAFYANPAGARDAAGVEAFCRKIATTVSGGSRRLSSKGGAHRFPGFSDDRLVITVPDGFVPSTQQGPDFSVYRLRKLAPLGQPQAVCGIYLGWHPAYHYRQTNDPPGKVTRIKGKLFGREIEWQNWSEADGITSEIIVPYPMGEGMFMHVFCTASTAEEIQALRAVAETLRVEEPKR